MLPLPVAEFLGALLTLIFSTASAFTVVFVIMAGTLVNDFIVAMEMLVALFI
jgi:hypothetical protein